MNWSCSSINKLYRMKSSNKSCSNYFKNKILKSKEKLESE